MVDVYCIHVGTLQGTNLYILVGVSMSFSAYCLVDFHVLFSSMISKAMLLSTRNPFILFEVDACDVTGPLKKKNTINFGYRGKTIRRCCGKAFAG